MSTRPFKISDHARKKMSLRSVTKDEVFDTILAYERTDKKDNVIRYFKGLICVVVAEGRHFDNIVTVLLNEFDVWSDHDARNRHK
jgi:hypothetical protein